MLAAPGTPGQNSRVSWPPGPRLFEDQTMAQKRNKRTEVRPASTLGAYLRSLRMIKRLSLRDVEEASGVSNGYLNQIENDKIERPSPHILHKLAGVYGISYEILMEKAGYITRTNSEGMAKEKTRSGKLPTFARESLTEEEEEALLEYLAFLRFREGKK